MEKIKITVILLSLFLPVVLHAQTKPGYEITGDIDGLQEGEKVTMRMFTGPGWRDEILTDSGIVRNGQFHIEGWVPEGPRIYWLEFGKHGSTCTLVIDNNQRINIHGMDVWKFGAIQEHVTIEGSPTQKGFDDLVSMERLYLQNSMQLHDQFKKIQDSVGFDRPLVEEVIKTRKLLDFIYGEMLLSYATSFTKPLLPWILEDTWETDNSGHQAFNAKIYNQLTNDARQSFYGKALKDISALSEGQPMPDFKLAAPDGKQVALKDITTGSKLTLVWFWATNSYKEDNYEAELTALYPRYHDKGLNIIGVSADTSKDDWQFRIHQKKFPWTNVSDLKGWKKGGIINDVYHEGGARIPNTTNVLVDQKGNIVAWDPTGVELQWYLWKYLDNQEPIKPSKSL